VTEYYVLSFINVRTGLFLRHKKYSTFWQILKYRPSSIRCFNQSSSQNRLTERERTRMKERERVRPWSQNTRKRARKKNFPTGQSEKREKAREKERERVKEREIGREKEREGNLLSWAGLKGHSSTKKMPTHTPRWSSSTYKVRTRLSHFPKWEKKCHLLGNTRFPAGKRIHFIHSRKRRKRRKWQISLDYIISNLSEIWVSIFLVIIIKTSRCPYRAFGCYLKVILVTVIFSHVSQIMSNHVILVRLWNSCRLCNLGQIMSNHVILVK
jgi:hypothetical protein